MTDPLAPRLVEAANAAQVAGALVATWRDIDAALTPLLGQRGVAALYKRSLYLTAAHHPWLKGPREGIERPMDLALLNTVLQSQSTAEARAAGTALLHTFQEVLASLIGPSLTERLLRPVWANSPGGAPGQEST